MALIWSIHTIVGHGIDGPRTGVRGMSASEWINVQEAMIYVFWPIFVLGAEMMMVGGLLAGVFAAAMQIAHGGRRKHTF